MSNNRVQRQRAKTVLAMFVLRLRRVRNMLFSTGRNPKGAVQHMKKKMVVDRARWRRWYRANQKYQRRLAALRRAGAGVKNMPTSLMMVQVP